MTKLLLLTGMAVVLWMCWAAVAAECLAREIDK